MANEMVRQEFAEYMAAFEQRLDGRFGQIDRRFAQVDARLAALEQSTSIQFEELRRGIAQLDGRMKIEFEDAADSLEQLEQGIHVRFEDAKGDFRLSLEAVAALREVTERGFSDMRREHASQTSLMHNVLHHARARVDKLERRAPGGEG